MKLRSAIVGGWAALRVPFRLRGDGLAALTTPPHQLRPGPAFDPASMRAARLVLRVMGRLTGGVWRNTCLFRSAAEVLLRRAAGERAVLRLGARRANETIGAHAWVESDGVPVGDDAVNADAFVQLG